MSKMSIQGFEFEIPAPFAEGHVLKANEASQLNQVFRENVRNNLRSTIDEAKEEAAKAHEINVDDITSDHLDLNALQEVVTAYAAEYEFGTRSGGGRGPSDPIGKEAMRLARDQVANAIRAQGRNPSDFKAADISEYARLLLDSDRGEAIRAQAKTNVEAAAQLSSNIDLGALLGQAAE